MKMGWVFFKRGNECADDGLYLGRPIYVVTDNSGDVNRCIHRLPFFVCHTHSNNASYREDVSQTKSLSMTQIMKYLPRF